LCKRFEDHRLLPRRDPNAGIAHGESKRATWQVENVPQTRIERHFECDLTAFGKLRGVSNQVQNDLAESARVP
jgi:hypothetical protein